MTGQGGRGQGWGTGQYLHYQAEGQVVKSTDLTSLGFVAILLYYINYLCQPTKVPKIITMDNATSELLVAFWLICLCSG